jgi:hypothetical protein
MWATTSSTMSHTSKTGSQYSTSRDRTYWSRSPEGMHLYRQYSSAPILIPLLLPKVFISGLTVQNTRLCIIGATDDGMGVVSLLFLIEYLAQKPPLRTAIFNLNNGEEDGLCGSHVLAYPSHITCSGNIWVRRFFQHPWSKETALFLNLEGAGSGGCAFYSPPASKTNQR